VLKRPDDIQVRSEIGSLACPLCGHSALHPTSQTVVLQEILRRWQEESNVVFPRAVWQEYEPPSPQQVTLHICSTCGYGVFLTIVTGSRGFYGIVTSGAYYTDEKWEFHRAIQDLKHYGARNVLDVGCGSGYFLDRVKRDAPEVADRTGYEFNAQSAATARSRGHEVYEGPFPDTILRARKEGLYDAVTMFQVLEHVADPTVLIRGARTLLSPAGRLLIGVPDSQGPLRHFRDAITDVPPHHVSRWCRSTFEVAAPRLGFRVIHCETEPLPFYLWDSYLPVILEHDLHLGMIARLLDRTSTIRMLGLLLRRAGVKWLGGVPGHTVYVDMQPGASVHYRPADEPTA